MNGPVYETATIPAGQALSGQANLGALTLVGIYLPATWTAASLTFQASPDGGVTWCEMQNNAGAAISVTASPGAFVALDPELWMGVNCIKIRSGTLASPVNQTAAAPLNLALGTKL